jgi:hypothetical protein
MTRRAAGSTAVLLLASLALLAPAPGAAQEHRFGGGVHYWKTVDEIADELPDFDLEEDGLTGVLSYQYVAGFTRFELAAEYFEAGFQGSNDWAVAPQAYVLVGRGFYGGIGAGVTYSDFGDGDWSDPYFIGKVGVDLLLLPKIHLDINADYRFAEWEALEDYDTDTITLGATVRFTLN